MLLIANLILIENIVSFSQNIGFSKCKVHISDMWNWMHKFLFNLKNIVPIFVILLPMSYIHVCVSLRLVNIVHIIILCCASFLLLWCYDVQYSVYVILFYFIHWLCAARYLNKRLFIYLVIINNYYYSFILIKANLNIETSD